MTAFVLNGESVEVDLPGSTRLLFVLRNHLGLKGAKLGCGQGECGACTVVLDGRAVQSCDIALEMVEGRRVLTLEGLGSGGDLHPLQRAFLELQAAQCGYCIPGILMSAAALLESNREPARADIVRALERNLCRCGAHLRIVRAIERAAQVTSPPPAERA